MISRHFIIVLGLLGLAACGGGGAGGASPPVAPPAPASTATPVPAASSAPANVNSSPLTFAKPVDPAAPPVAMSGDFNATSVLATAKLGAVHLMPVQNLTAGSSKRRAPRSIYYPEDVPYNGGTVISSAQIHPVYVQTFWDNCSTACWGNPAQGIADLAASNFLHVVDPYVGFSQSNRYTLGQGSLWSLAPFPSHAGNPVIGQSEILLLLYYAAYNFGTGYNHIYHVFLPPNIDTCIDLTSSCYSPDHPSTFRFCGYHSSANFGSGPIIFSVLPYADVPACRITNGPNASGGHDLVDSTINVMSHETFEAITDPVPFTGWYSAYFDQEIGDICAQYWLPTTLNGTNYGLQAEYSNGYHACTNAP